MNDTRLIIDKSSILGAFLHLTDDEYGEDIHYKGKDFHIPSVETCMERFKYSFAGTLKMFDLRSMDVIVVKDPVKKRSALSARERIYPEYKSKKRVSPPEFFKARKDLFELADVWLKEQGCILATPQPTVEADDLLNEFAARLPKTLLWTRDKDLLACPTNVLLSGREGIDVNPEKFPVPDEFIHLYRVLVTGDTSDGLGSCKGFGPKAFEGMVKVFGEDCLPLFDALFKEQRLHELAEDVGDYPQLQLIIDQAEELYPIYQCMQFFHVPAHKIKWEAGMQCGTSTLVTAENYDEIYKKVEASKFEYSVIDFESDVCEESRAWLKQTGTDDQKRVKVDVIGSEICGMGLRVENENYYFSVDHKDTDNIHIDELESILEVLYGRKVYAHNSTGFENILLYTHFDTFLPEMRDTTIMASYVDENDSTHLKHLSKKHLGYDQTTYSEVLDGRSGMREVTGKEAVEYGIDDVITCDALQNLFTVRMIYEGTLDTFEEVEIDSAYVTSLSFVNGVDFDAEVHARLRKENNESIAEAWALLNKELLAIGWDGAKFIPVKGKNMLTFNRVYKAYHGEEYTGATAVKTAVKQLPDDKVAQLFGTGTVEEINEFYKSIWKPEATLNLRSPKQMGKLFYEVLDLPVRIRNMPTDKMRKEGKPGTPSTDEEAINNAIAFGDSPEHDGLLRALIEYKGFLTKESLFYAKYHHFVHWKTGKLHSNMGQCAATTRRFSHSKPNLAQLSKKKGKAMRDMITVPGPDWYLWALDIDSQELQLQAWASQDANFLACYMGADKKDMHSLTGYEVSLKQGASYKTYAAFYALIEEETKPFRVTGKAVNFATAYLCKARRLASMLAITLEEAVALIEAKAAAFPGLLPAIEAYCKECEKRGYSLTMMGARRHLQVHYAKGRRSTGMKESADRLAWSYRIQSSAGEQIRMAMARMWRAKVFEDRKNFPVTVIHDEAVGIIHGSVMAKRMPVMYDCICDQYADMGIQVSSTPEIGSHFGSLKKYELER